MAVFKGERGEVVDTEVNPNSLFVRRFSNFDFDFADEVQFPLVTSPDSSDLSNVLHGGEVNIRANLVLAQSEVRPILLEVRAFAESDSPILSVEFEASGFEYDRTSRVVIAVFAVAGWICFRVSVASFTVPAGERFSEFLKDSLT